MAEQNTFDPSRYLTKVGQADYLEVKWRMVWLRELHPDAAIVTELVQLIDPLKGPAIFRATVSIPGGGSASGYGSEDVAGFREFIEKAETKAIGRALAGLGFGTQFCGDFEFGADQGKVVDSPVNRNGQQNAPQTTTARQNGSGATNGNRPQIMNPDAPASDKQLGFIRSLAKDAGMVTQQPDGTYHTDESALVAIVGAQFQQDWPRITKQTASELIEQLQSERTVR